MGDMADDFAAMRAATKAKHGEWNHKNSNVLQTSGLKFKSTNYGETFCFREPGKPMVDFYPSTGRWRIVGGTNGKPFRGGAESFLRWYEKQKV